MAKKLKLDADGLTPLLQSVVSNYSDGYANIRFNEIKSEVEFQESSFQELGMGEQSKALFQPFYDLEKFIESYFPQNIEENKEVVSLKVEDGVIEGIYLPCICEVKGVPAIKCGKAYLEISKDFRVGTNTLNFRFNTVKQNDFEKVVVWAILPYQKDEDFLIPVVLDSSVYDLDQDQLEDKFSSYSGLLAGLRPLSTSGGFCRLRDLEVGVYEILGVKEKENTQYGLIQLVCLTPDGKKNVELNSYLKKLVENPYKALGDVPTEKKEQLIFKTTVQTYGGFLHIKKKEQKKDKVYVTATIAPFSDSQQGAIESPNTVRELPESQTQTVDVEVSETKEVSEADLENIPF